MRTLGAILLVGLLVLSTAPFAPAMAHGPAAPPATGRPAPAYGAGARADGFVENAGQFGDADVRYYASWPGGGIAFLAGGIAMTVREPMGGLDKVLDHHASPSVRGCTVRLSFEGARDVSPIARCPLPTVRNYYIGDDPAAWRTGVRAFSEVVYEGLYDGIDLVYRSTAQGVKYDVLVSAGADASVLRVRAQGQASLSLREGALVMGTPYGALVDAAPVARYADGEREALDCSFALLGNDVYGFRLDGRDESRAVVIDPLVYATYIGDDGEEVMLTVRLDASGKVYVAGYTTSSRFPTTAGAYQSRLMGWYDGIVSRFSADGRTLEMSTYLGGGSEIAVVQSMDIDGSGDIYLGGGTSSFDFPVTANAPQPTHGGGYENGFLTKLKADGSELLYSTYFGGEEYDYVISVAVDGDGCLYATGGTGSYTMPVTPGAFQGQYQEGGGDAFAVKVSAAGDEFTYSTYIGGTEDEEGHGIAVDDEGNAYIAGYTYSYDFPTTPSAFTTVMPGYGSAWVMKLAGNGSYPVYSTYLGGSSYQTGEDIALGDGGEAWVTGHTYSTDFPTTSEAYQPDLEGDLEDLFVTRMSADGSSVVASTLLGGRDSEFSGRLALDPDGNPIVCGNTMSVDYPTTPGAAQTRFQGEIDGMVSKLSADLSELEYSSYIGGSAEDAVVSVATTERDYVWGVGVSSSTDFPVTADAYQSLNQGEYDGLLLRLIMDSVPPIAVAGDDLAIDQHQTVELNGSRSSDNLGIVNHTWTFRYNGSDVVLYGPVASFTFDEAGRCTVTLTVRDLGARTASDELNVTVRDITPPFASAGSDVTVNQHDLVYLDSSRSKDNVGIVSYEWTFLYGGTQHVLTTQSPSFQFDDAGTYDVTLNVTDAVGLWATDAMRVVVIDTTGPTAEAGSVINLKQHEVAAFDGTGSTDNVGVVNWTWAFVYVGLPISLYGASPTFLFDTAGRYTVTLTVRDDRGLSATDTTEVIVTDVDPPAARAGEDVTVDQGEAVAFDGRASTDNVGVAEATWTFVVAGDEKVLEGLLSDFTFVDAGVYEVTLTVRDAMGNEATDALTVTVRDVEPPLAMAGADVHIDQHQTAQLDARGSVDNVGIVFWTWTLTYRGAPVMLQGETVSQLFDDAGTYTVNLTVADAAGNLATDSLTVTVKDTTAPVADAGPEVTVDQSRELALDGSNSTDNVGIVEWEWTFLDEGTSIRLKGEHQRYTFTVPGRYNVTLVVADAEGSTGSTVLVVRVRDVMDPVAVAPGRLTVKAGETTRLDGSSSSDNVGVVSWVWTFRDDGRDVVREGSTVSYSFKDEGEHLVTLTVTDAEGNTATDSFTVTVEADLLPLLMLLVVVVVIVVLAVVALVLMRRGKRSAS